MKTLGHKVSETQLKEIMKLIDENGDGKCLVFNIKIKLKTILF